MIKEYRFAKMKDNPNRVNVFDPQGMHVAWIPIDAAVMTAMMYENMLKNKGRAVANEFMYGYLLGMSHAMLYADQLPKITIHREGGHIKLAMHDPETGASMQPTDIHQVPDSNRQAMNILKKTFGKDEEDDDKGNE